MPKLFKIIASELNCTWSLDPSKDGLFGATKEDGTWNGIIGELIRGELDISLADLSVTSERARVSKVIHIIRSFMKIFCFTRKMFVILIT